MPEPIKKFRAGTVTCSIWENTIQKDGREFKVNNVSLDRRYKDREGNWKSTPSLQVNDIQRAILCLQKAQEYLLMKKEEETEDVEGRVIEEEIVTDTENPKIKMFKEMLQKKQITKEGYEQAIKNLT